MKLTKTINIEKGKVTATVACAELGDDTYTTEEELEMINDYNKAVKYSDIKFSAKMIYENGAFEILADDESDGEKLAKADEVKLDLINKEIPLNETFNAKITINVDQIKIVGENTITSKELMAQAKATLYVTKISEDISKILTKLRALQPDVEGTTEEIV